ncbi:hypothetical protein T459_28918 [Capsicum annuum]|uniref:Uncharacterized protein n=1 Tax=Capsicum annuum TaxID=4072 RepID=A0A2G2YIL5_CAPAN|nr:hypothetical protein T459_28918 [Capsicum annuum]
MTSLSIWNCKKLKRMQESMQELLPSLKELKLSGCPEIESFPDRGFPFNLQLLWIIDCEKLVNGRKEWRLQRLPYLRELRIHHNGSDEEIVGESVFPSSLSELTIKDCPNLRSLAESALPSSLSTLTIEDCPNLQSLAESGLPSSLSQLTISDCPNLQSLQ